MLIIKIKYEKSLRVWDYNKTEVKIKRDVIVHKYQYLDILIQWCNILQTIWFIARSL